MLILEYLTQSGADVRIESSATGTYSSMSEKVCELHEITVKVLDTNGEVITLFESIPAENHLTSYEMEGVEQLEYPVYADNVRTAAIRMLRKWFDRPKSQLEMSVDGKSTFELDMADVDFDIYEHTVAALEVL